MANKIENKSWSDILNIEQYWDINKEFINNNPEILNVIDLVSKSNRGSEILKIIDQEKLSKNTKNKLKILKKTLV